MDPPDDVCAGLLDMAHHWHKIHWQNNTPLGVLDAEGWAICPDCRTRIHCGPVGIANLELRHRPSKTCKETKAKRDKEAKKKKDGSILTFFKRPKAIPVPSAVSPSAAHIHGHDLPTMTEASPASLPIISPPNRVAVQHVVDDVEPVKEPFVGNFLKKLYYLIENLPATIPEALDYDQLAI